MYRVSSRDFTGFTGAARVRSSTASVHATRHVGHRADDSVAPAALVPSSLRTRGFSSSPRLRTRRVQVKREWRRGFTASTATWRATVDPGNRVVALRGTATRRRPRRRQRPPLLGKAVRRKDRPSGFVIHQNRSQSSPSIPWLSSSSWLWHLCHWYNSFQKNYPKQ